MGDEKTKVLVGIRRFRKTKVSVVSVERRFRPGQTKVSENEGSGSFEKQRFRKTKASAVSAKRRFRQFRKTKVSENEVFSSFDEADAHALLRPPRNSEKALLKQCIGTSEKVVQEKPYETNGDSMKFQPKSGKGIENHWKSIT